MAKSKGRTSRIFDRIGTPATIDPKQEGLRLFLAGNLDGAIAAWKAVTPPTDDLRAALAEAYLRRALRGGAQHLAADLRQAESLLPQDPRIQYLLGLVAHRAGDLSAAAAHYRAALQADPAWPGPGLLLGLVTLRQDPRADLVALPGCTPEIRASLAPIQTLLLGGEPDDGKAVAERFWHGLGLIRREDGSAREALDDNRPLPAARATAIRRYYRGVAAAQQGDLEAAIRAWQHSVHDDGRSPWMADNLVSALLQDGGARLTPASLREDAAFAQLLRRLAAGNTALAGELVKAHDDIAQRAAVEGNWTLAAAQWEQAREIVSESADLGSPRTFWHNLAIAYEALERWPQAAEAWRAMLRTKPRTARRAAGELDYSDEQWAWIRKRVVECYKRAGTPGEAVTLFRQALKKEPNDLETRMQLAAALLANDQEQAAMNELDRILKIDPAHVEARLTLAGIHVGRGEYQVALSLVRAVHAAYPEREDVTRALVGMLGQHGADLQAQGWYDRALAAYKEAEELAPDDWHLPLFIARVYVDQGKRGQITPALRRAEELANGDPSAYLLLIECWAVAGDRKEALAVLERGEATGGLPPDFYTQAAGALLDHEALSKSPFGMGRARGKPKPRPLVDLAVELVERGVARNAGSASYFRDAARTLMLRQSQVAERMAAEAVRLDPDSADIRSILGTILALNGKTSEAHQTLRASIRMARKAGKRELASHIETLDRLANDPESLRLQLEMAMTLQKLSMDDLDLDEDFLDL